MYQALPKIISCFPGDIDPIFKISQTKNIKQIFIFSGPRLFHFSEFLMSKPQSL